MGLTIRGSDRKRFPGAARYPLPSSIAGGLLAMHILMDGADNACRNWVPGMPAATKTGAIGESDGFLSLQTTIAFLKTTIVDQATGTMLIVARDTSGATDNSGVPIFAGSYGGGGGLTGASIFNQDAGMTANAGYQPNAGGNAYARSAQVQKLPETSWACLMSDWSATDTAGGTVHLYDMTRGLQGNSAAPGAPGTRVTNGLVYGIGTGGPGGGVFSGKSDGALFMIWNRVLAGSERADAYAVAKQLAATPVVPLPI